MEAPATTEMDFIYPMIMDPVTTKKPDQEPKITTIFDKVVDFITTTLSPIDTTNPEIVLEPKEILADTTVKPSPEIDLENKLFDPINPDLETELFDTTIMPDVAKSTTQKAKTGKLFHELICIVDKYSTRAIKGNSD